jgi:hypothetical protein
MKRPKKKHIGLPSQISGMAGVYYVAYELSRLNFVALTTSRNLEGIDLIVSNQVGNRQVSIQVKTMQKKAELWQVGKVPKYRKGEGNAFHVLVRLNKGDKPDCFIIPSRMFARIVNQGVAKWCKRKAGRNPASCSPLVYKFRMTKKREKQYLNKWNLIEKALRR